MNFKILGILLLVLSIGIAANAYAHTMEVVGDYKIEVGWENEPPVKGLDNAITFEVGIASDYDKAQAEAEDMAMEGMDMSSQQTDDYDTKIGPILDQFKAGKMTASMAINQISNIITTENPTDDFGKEIKYLTDDVSSGRILVDDAIYELIDMIGTVTQASTGMDHGSEMTDMAHDEHDHEEEHDISTERGLLDNFEASVNLGGKDFPLKLVEDSQFPGVYHADFTPSVEGSPMVHIVGTLAGEDVDITFHPERVEGLSALPPLKQVKEGISPKNVECKSEYVLLLKTSSNAPVCVSPSTSAKLVEMGWGIKA